MRNRHTLISLAAIIWAGPWSLLGILVGLLGVCSGGKYQRHDRIIEFYGGWSRRLLGRIPIAGGAAAITLGHIVIGRTAGDLDRARDHELIHVAQYERWGPLFVPAYLCCSLYLMIRGRDPYLENPFEKEAYQATTPDEA